MQRIWCKRWLNKRDGLSFPAPIPSSPAGKSCFTACLFFPPFRLTTMFPIQMSYFTLIPIVKSCKWINTYLLQSILGSGLVHTGEDLPGWVCQFTDIWYKLC